MTLENLFAIHKLQRFDSHPAAIQRLLAAAERNLLDAGNCDSMVETCCQQAAILLHETREWLQQYRPELLQG